MERNYNSQSFTPADVEKGLHLKLLNTLLELNKESELGYNDIHIWTDSYCTIIEWCFVFYDEYGNHFVFLNTDKGEHIMIERIFPDDHIEAFGCEEEYQNRLKVWLEENPGWVKTEYGNWTYKGEN